MPPGRAIPVIDVFAGPGGLGEGFASLRDAEGRRRFRLALSIEKDGVACKTLRTRAVRRLLEDESGLGAYYAWLRCEISREQFDRLPEVGAAAAQAGAEVIDAELGKRSPREIDRLIRNALGETRDWVLVGGPPCQAYSLAGRARRANDEAFEEDEKHFLYREYLRILRAHAPPVFIMENVKGLLSSRHGGRPMFSRICRDLSQPGRELNYEVRSFVKPGRVPDLLPEDFVIESERFGIPQARHRVILLGVRSDLAAKRSSLLAPARTFPTARDVLDGLPRVRSRLSKEDDSAAAWHEVLRCAAEKTRGYGDRAVIAAMFDATRSARAIESTGGRYIAWNLSPATRAREVMAWLHVPALRGVIQHETRSHMASDLQRYLFASSFAREHGTSPTLHRFPPNLLPDHESARSAGTGGTPFSDRFRVQCADQPSSTVVSHIAKDGHYYIHYDPSQCRSLTVREVARLQTFPDDYFFEGNRTQQYVQVGNAVPPLLASKIASVIADFFSEADHGDRRQRKSGPLAGREVKAAQGRPSSSAGRPVGTNRHRRARETTR
jgi:DNA (cytosine-5)-methyltransferase 1